MIRNTMLALSLVALTAGSAFAGNTKHAAKPRTVAAAPAAGDTAAPADEKAAPAKKEKKAKAKKETAPKAEGKTEGAKTEMKAEKPAETK